MEQPNTKTMKKVQFLFLCLCVFLSAAVYPQNSLKPADSAGQEVLAMRNKLHDYAVVKLTTDSTKLTAKDKKMILILIKVSNIMDELYWNQVIGDKKRILEDRKNPIEKQMVEINYGPWERLNGNKPFIKEFGERPLGANFYPADMSKDEFEKFTDNLKTSPYTFLRRNQENQLMCVWYHDEFPNQLHLAADLMARAADLADDEGLKKYLRARGEALLTDNYFNSDLLWMDMKKNKIDFVVGPIENYEDELFGYKTSYEAAILVKDIDWSKKLEHFTALLPDLQKQLPVDAKYKTEVPASGSDLNAYDLIYAGGDLNSGGKTIAINLPNDEKVQAEKGSRRLQLKNVMKAKFDLILVPISNMLTDSLQRKNIKFDAFFNNVMFHEVAHGLGIKNTINGKGTVREAMKEKYSAFEEAKADVLGLFLVTKLIERGEIKNLTVNDCFVTFMAGILRSVRFGASDSHGKANMMCFNFFEDKGAFQRNANGTYKVNPDKFRTAMNEWAGKVLIFEGDGDYKGASAYLETNGKIRPELQSDLERLRTRQIPLDIIYNQGQKVLGFK
jgi:hypothetical protein